MARRNKQQLFERITVTDVGVKGKGVAKTLDGMVLFIENVVPGDVVDVQTYKKRKSYAEGKAVAFYELSPNRVTPLCVHFGVCGGCQWQDLNYAQQLYFKQKTVENNLLRIGQLELPEIIPILGAPEPYYYRNKMEFSFSDSRWLTPEEIIKQDTIYDRHALGFHIPGMWDKILDLKECHLQAPLSNRIRLGLRQFALDNQLSFFNPKQKTGLLRSVMLRNTLSGQWMVLIQFFENNPQEHQRVLDYLANQFPEITSLQYVINQKANDTLYDLDILTYKGSDYIEEEMEGLRFRITAKSFYQTNSKQAHRLYQITRDFANFSGDELVYDLYTGTGTIAQFIARSVKKVVGIEAVPEAIRAAQENAIINGIDNVSFFVGDMKQVFTPEFIAQHGRPDVIITDPPRDGMHPMVVEQILQIAPKKVVYVSCNSATQARDLALMKHQYRVVKVQPVDMFPQTYHVENVVLLEKI